MEGTQGSTAGSKQKTKLKGNKKEEKEKNPKGKVGRGKGKDIVLNCAKFEGQGLSYKAKLFGFVEVPGPRGDDSSVQAIQKLKLQAKQMKKDSNEHKLKITFNITLEGVRLFNEKTQAIEHEHPIHKISFISHDPEDRHVFGYIYSPPRSSANEKRKYYLYAIKSDKSADVITVQLYELFQVVYKMQENRKTQSKDNTEIKQRWQEKSSQPLEPLQNKMLLEMSNKIAGDQQQYPHDEHVYAEPTFVKRTSTEPSSDYAVPNDQIVLASSVGESNEYQVPRQDDQISEKEREDIATAIALSLSMKENSQLSPDAVSTPTGNDDSGFEVVCDPTAPLNTEEVSNQNSFHAEFPLFENGFISSESRLDFSETCNNSEKFSMPVVSEMPQQSLKDTSFNAFDDVSSDNVMKIGFKTSENTNSETHSDVESSSKPSVEATSSSSKMEDVNYHSTKVEFQPVEGSVKEMLSTNSTFGDSSSLETEKQDDETETSTTSGNFDTVASFEVSFKNDKEDEKSSKQNQPAMFSFDVFSNEDPFESTGPTNFDESTFIAFGDDDPFSPKGGSNVDIKSDPFSENENPFTADFSDVHTDDFKPSEDDIPVHANSESDENSHREDDIFEAMFEAKMEEQLEDETVNKKESENEELENIEHDQVELDLEKQNDYISEELENTEKKESTEITEESQTEKSWPHKNPTEHKGTEVLNDSPDVHNEISNDQHVSAEGSKDKNMNEANTFDFSSNNVYVTLKTAATLSNIPQSPTEFSPPPLPPRPVAPKEPNDTVISPKIPPALPPRPTKNQPPNSEITVRRPPELPPRLDLDQSGLVENGLEDTIQEPNVQSFAKDMKSPMFQADFDTFDFDDIENNHPAEGVRTPTAEFDSDDPFKDPFAGADPFQTPLASDPFASSTSFDRNVQHDTDDFDPFFGDDPFAMTPAFDAETSFGSPKLPSNDELNNDEEKAKFADFSEAFT